ncbi:hypothetical protein [Streptomyces mobaraensis]|uniref:Uncharacterized protein n=1 Tax=Streptomyces mobaraensis TaxID=35621 RepID=A0A5N5VXF4_STRMB|nr:hypothetical protein [Streptomyces mobaraensis]KAB7833536.1 hypothetical protein FRZ00_33350 [Streptomyces mobaraensis]
MKLRLPFRRRTVPAAAGPVWTQPGHFRRGDEVVGRNGFIGTVAYVTDDNRIGVGSPGWKMGPAPIGDVDMVRHAANCSPCQADHARRQAEEQLREANYQDRWSIEERNVYDAVMADMRLTTGSAPGGPCPSNGTRYAFGPNSPVREWMRTEFDGHMVDSESPSLSLGRIWDPLDWLRIEREHAGDGLSIVPWGDLPWATIRRAYAYLQETGLTVVLDADLEMALLDDGTVGVEVWPSHMNVEGVVPDEIEQQVNTILGSTPEDYPHSALIWPSRPDRPGTDYTAPYRRSTYNHTMWLWA